MEQVNKQTTRLLNAHGSNELFDKKMFLRINEFPQIKTNLKQYSRHQKRKECLWDVKSDPFLNIFNRNAIKNI